MKGGHNRITSVGRVSVPDTESLCKTIFGITPRELEVVVCLVAAQACGRPGATIAQIVEVTGHKATNGMRQLERNRWVSRVGVLEQSTALIWAATPLAVRRLGLTDWQVELQPEGERAAS